MAEDQAVEMKPEKDEKGRFVSGNIGGGRPKGSRNKLGEAFVADIYEDWQEHGAEVIQAVRAEKPDVYMRVIASILPKDLNVNVNPLEEATDDELIQRLSDLTSAIQPFLAAAGSGEDSEGTGTQTTH